MSQLQTAADLPRTIAGLGLGCWVFGGDAWGGQDDDDSITVMDEALAQGVNHFDTAIGYGGGRSERIVGQFIRDRDARARICLATKGNMPKMTPEQAREQLQRSLENLGLDSVDLYYIHWPRSGKDMRPVMEQLERLRDEGLLKAIGVSNFSVEQMQHVSEVGTIDAHQLCYSLYWRYPEAEIIPYCQEQDIAVVTYSSLAQGILTGKFPKQPTFAEGDQRPKAVVWFKDDVWPTVYETTQRLKTLADEAKHPLTHLAVQWVLNQPGVTSVLVGARTPEQLRQSLAAREAKVAPAVLEQMTQLSEDVRAAIPAEAWNIFGMNP